MFSSLTALSLALPLFVFAPPTEADPANAGGDPAAEAPSEEPGEPSAAPGEGDGEALPPGSPEDAAVMAAIASLDPAAVTRLDELGEQELQALLDRDLAGEELGAEDRAVVDAYRKIQNAAALANMNLQHGTIDMGEGLANLETGDAYAYLDPNDSNYLLSDLWGNPPGPAPLGVLVPSDFEPFGIGDKSWAVVITYEDDGHVDDSDDVDFDEVLEAMKEADEQDNQARIAAGYTAVNTVGWAEPPHIDRDRHALYWAVELDFNDGTPVHTLNYNLRVLGRTGVLVLNAVTTMDQIEAVRAPMEDIFTRVSFNDGNRYSQFDPDIDKVAAYGLGGLIAGKIALKAGLFAGLFKFLLAAKKLVILGIAGIGAFFFKIFGRRKEDE